MLSLIRITIIVSARYLFEERHQFVLEYFFWYLANVYFAARLGRRPFPVGRRSAVLALTTGHVERVARSFQNGLQDGSSEPRAV